MELYILLVFEFLKAEGSFDLWGRRRWMSVSYVSSHQTFLLKIPETDRTYKLRSGVCSVYMSIQVCLGLPLSSADTTCMFRLWFLDRRFLHMCYSNIFSEFRDRWKISRAFDTRVFMCLVVYFSLMSFEVEDVVEPA